MSAGAFSGIEGRPPQMTSTVCNADGTIGTLAVVPAGAKDAEVALLVVAGDNRPHESCVAPDYGPGCVVARRILRFIPHTPLTLPIELRQACEGISCATDETCVRGACKSARVSNVADCTAGASCDESTLSPADGGAAETDAAADAAPLYADASLTDAGAPPAVYNSMTDPQYWATVDVASIAGATNHLLGGAFDGRYLHFSATFYGGSKFARYDTQAPFTQLTSWAGYDSGESGWGGAAFDGRFVFFLPLDAVSLRRYDPSIAYDNPSAWQPVQKAAVGLANSVGALLDGKYLYVAPNAGTSFSRLDIGAPFDALSSWEHFPVNQLSPSTDAVYLGCSDGRYVYYTPDDASGTVIRYDTTGPFSQASSWQSVDLLKFDAQYQYIVGAAFDGRYVYAPSRVARRVLRYDTAAPFGVRESWQEHALPSSIGGTVFDGRYVYFASQDSVTAYRYDTTMPFSSGWTAFDAQIGPVEAMAFDGTHVYFLPRSTSKVARFRALAPGSGPPRLPGRKGTF